MTNRSILRDRARWLRAPGALLMVLLQRTPAVNVTVAVEQVIVGSPIGALLKSAATVAALGAVNTLAGATPLVPSSGAASGITVTVGEPVSVFYSVTGTISPADSWQITGTIPAGLNFSGLTAPGTVNASPLELRGTPTTAGTYNMGIKGFNDPNGTGFETMVFAYTITVNGPATSPPSFTMHPTDQSVTVGASVTFNSAASGSPAPSFQWRKNNVDIGGATASSLTLNGITEGDAGSYTVVATNSRGSATSNAATLTVNAAPAAPSFSNHPASQSVPAGSGVTFTATASGNPAPAYQWRKDGNNIGGATGNSYSIGSVSAGDAGSYTVVATNSQGSATSNAAVLTVGAALSAPAISMQPASQVARIGSAVSFTVTANGNPAPTLQWRKNGIAIGGATGASLMIPAVTWSDAGDYSVVATNSQGTATSNSATLTVRAARNSDFNGDGRPDILWQNTATGQRTVWFMNGATLLGDAAIATLPTEWSMAAADDLNGDGHADILWQNTTTGQRTVWFMNGANLLGDATIATLPTEWTIAGTGDFNNDGHADILWQNTATGQSTAWFMNGATLLGDAPIANLPPEWTMAGTGDLNGDARPDIVWQNTATGQRTVWFMNGVTLLGDAALNTVPPEWSIVQVDDFNGDGHPDLVWQNTVTGQATVWYLNGTTLLGDAPIANLPLEWSIAGSRAGAATTPTYPLDFNDDGHPDIVWQNTATGERAIWFMSGAAYTGSASLGTVPVAWSMAGAADFDGDRHPDIIWENTATGERAVWFMNGAAYSASASLGTVPVAWRIAGAADFNADDHSDLIWENTATGEHAIWFMNGGAYSGAAALGTLPTAWHIAGVADFNGDNHPDILWENTGTGERAIWFMNGAAYSSSASLGTVPAAWRIAGAVDFNGDSHPDILWQNTATGERAIWFMNGASYSSAVSLGIIPVAWSIAE